MTGFDAIARSYDQVWTATPVGKLQRRAVWDFIDPLFVPGSVVLDLGCGTGADAAHLESLGVRVCAIDSSSEMVKMAQTKNIQARQQALEDIDQLGGMFDGAISNFGAVNCVASLNKLVADLGRLVRPGGYVALCFLGRFCLWETVYYVVRGQFGKAARRFRGRTSSSYSLDVFYPSRKVILNAFRSQFVLVVNSGIGLTVPPSYVKYISGRTLGVLAAVDVRFASKPGFRSLSDHQLYIWQRS